MMRSLWPLALVIAAGIGCDEPELAGPSWHVQDDEVSLDSPSPVRFDVAKVVLGDPLPSPTVTARVTTVELLTSPSYPPLSGRIAEIPVRMGDRVESGDRLVRVQTSELPTLQGELATARLAVETKQAMIDKLERMVEARLAPEHDLILARAELAAARLAVKTAKSRLHSLAVGDAGDASYWILASRSGTIVQLDAALGQAVRPEQSVPVATVADLDEVLVIGDVSQREAARLHTGDRALIRVPGSMAEPIEGNIELVSEVLDPERQTVPVRARAANLERQLRPNAWVDVGFAPTEQTPVVRVPSSALVRDGAETIVFVQTDGHRYRARRVEVGRRSKDLVEIVRGLAPGESIVVTNALLLLNAIDTAA